MSLTSKVAEMLGRSKEVIEAVDNPIDVKEIKDIIIAFREHFRDIWGHFARGEKIESPMKHFARIRIELREKRRIAFEDAKRARG
jgi:hypothetical protein